MPKPKTTKAKTRPSFDGEDYHDFEDPFLNYASSDDNAPSESSSEEDEDDDLMIYQRLLLFYCFEI